MGIKCCYGCTAPKRYPGCHSHCPDYAKEKAADDAKKAEERKKRDIEYAIIGQRGRAVMKAMKHRQKGKHCEQ